MQSAKIAAIIGLAFGAANYVFGLPAYWLSDKIGRSIMLALGLPNMAWSMLVFAFLFKIPDASVRTPLVSIFAVIFVAFYAPTAGTSPFSISAEVSCFPVIVRIAKADQNPSPRQVFPLVCTDSHNLFERHVLTSHTLGVS